jgi:hypothetical protein
VFQDVRQVRAGPQALEKAPPLADAAAMLDHRREPRRQPVGKTGH